MRKRFVLIAFACVAGALLIAAPFTMGTEKGKPTTDNDSTAEHATPATQQVAYLGLAVEPRHHVPEGLAGERT